MFRNRLLWWQLGFMAIAAACLCAMAWWLEGPVASLWCGLVAAVGIGIAVLFSYLRYREIAKISASLDEVLHGKRVITFGACREGDVAILSNEIQKLTARLVRTSELLAQEKTALAAALEDISHQIRTPLTSVSLMVPLVANAENPSQRKQLLRDLERLVGRTSWLVTALLQLAKLDAGALEFERKEVTAETLFGRAAEPLLLSYDLKDVSLTFENAEMMTYIGDERWGAEALGNVLKNCLEHTPRGGRVKVTAHQTTLASSITVSDTGNGFTEEDLPHIFERFYRGSSFDDGPKPEGFGIGLAFARALTEAQGGSLTASNRNSGGAQFVFTFPKFVV